MKFYTEQDNVSSTTPVGTKFKRLYKISKDSKGKRVLVEAGKSNVYDKIQSQKDNALLYSIIEKYQRTGDASLLTGKELFYVDLLDVPTNPAEVQNMMILAEQTFNGLDKEIRAEFENDYGVFQKSVLDGSFANKMSKFVKKEEPTQQTQQPTQQTTEQGVNI